MMELFHFVVIILGIVNGILVPVLFIMGKSIAETKKEISNHKLHVANYYTKSSDLKAEFSSIDHKLEGIWDEIKELRKNGGRIS